MLGIISSSMFDFVRNFKEETVSTDFGKVKVLKGDVIFIPRHQGDTPPHKLNHKAHIAAFEKLGVKKIIGTNSAGSLKINIKPSSIVIPHDYINLWSIQTFFDNKIEHITPGFDEDLRKEIVLAAKKAGVDVFDKGVYFQATGPRLETKAEIKLLASFADIVGMTMANEATLAKEAGLGFANISSVDNYAHGLTDEVLKDEDIIANQKKNKSRVEKILLKLV